MGIEIEHPLGYASSGGIVYISDLPVACNSTSVHIVWPQGRLDGGSRGTLPPHCRPCRTRS